TRPFAHFYFYAQEADVDPASGDNLCVACRADELRHARRDYLCNHRLDICRHRCGPLRAILRPEPARTVAAQHAPAAIYFDLYRGCRVAVCCCRSPVAPAYGPIGYIAESLSAAAVRPAIGGRIFGDWHRRYAHRSFHRHRNPVSPDDRYLSPTGPRRKGA